MIDDSQTSEEYNIPDNQSHQYKETTSLLSKYIQHPRHGHSGSQSGFGFVQSGFGFSGLSKSVPFGLYKNSVRDRFGFYRVRIGVSKSSKNRYNPVYFRVLGSNRFFGFKVLDLHLFCNQNISKIDSEIRKKHQTWSFKVNERYTLLLIERKPINEIIKRKIKFSWNKKNIQWK